MTVCYLSIGGNVGDVETTLARALDTLADDPATEVLGTSGLFEDASRWVTRPGEADFLNAAIRIRTALSPLQFLDLLQSTEDSLGRIRKIRWGPRTIDLDVILWDDAIINETRLSVPHPGLLVSTVSCSIHWSRSQRM